MQRIRIKGTASFRSTPAEYMRDMLRYDDGRIEAIWDYPTGKRFESVPFTAIVQLNGYTPDRWRSFGLYPDVLGDVGEYSAQGYTVDEWVADRSPVQEAEKLILCDFCESPIDDEEADNHRCLARQYGCGCGEDCPIKVDKCECSCQKD